jgi:hypothetical protein
MDAYALARACHLGRPAPAVAPTHLDAPLVLTPISEARFLKLVPLVGG